jgi:hypothetical protein
MARRTIDLAFAGANGGTFPATWSQRELWWTINHHKPGGFYQLWQTFDLPESWPLDAVIDLLRFLVIRHQALRSKVRLDDEGRLWQVIAASGSLPVQVEDVPYRADIAEFTTRLRKEYLAVEPDLQQEFPLKLAIITSNGQPRSALLVCSHAVLDSGSLPILQNEVGTLIARKLDQKEKVLRPVAHRPEDQAREEGLESARRITQKSLAYWRSVLMDSPPGLFSEVEAGRAPLWIGSLTSRAMGEAESALVREAGLASSALYLGATCCVLASVTGKSRMTFRLPAGNRPGVMHRNFVGAVAQHAILNIELIPVSFYELIRLLERRLSLACSRTRYDPDELRQVIREVAAIRGADLDLTYLFNDLRPETRRQAQRHLRAGSSSSMPESAVSWDLLHTANSDIKIRARIGVSAADGDPVLDLAADESCMTRPEIERSLRAIETLIVNAARRDFPLTEAERIAGLRT